MGASSGLASTVSFQCIFYGRSFLENRSRNPSFFRYMFSVSACFLVSHLRCGTRQRPLAAKGLVECGLRADTCCCFRLYSYLRRLSAALQTPTTKVGIASDSCSFV